MKQQTIYQSLGALLRTFILLCGLHPLSHAIAEDNQSAVKIAMYSPTNIEENGVYVWLKAFADELKKTNLPVRFYPNGSLGGDQERIDQMALDLLEMNVTNPDEISRLSPTFYGISALFMFNTYQHMERFLTETPFIETVNKELEGHGFKLVDMAYTGAMVGLLTRKVPVRSIAELQKIRLRFLSAPDLKLFDAWGVHGVQVSWSEVAQALQTGMVDGYLNPPYVATMYGHGSVLDYFTNLRMGPSARLIVVATSWLESLSPSQRIIYEQAIKAGRKANRAWNILSIEKDKERLSKAGITWIEPSQEERQEWADKTINFLSEKWFDADKTALVEQWVAQTKEASQDE